MKIFLNWTYRDLIPCFLKCPSPRSFCTAFLAFSFLLFNNTPSHAQTKRIVTIGSSTTSGYGATSKDSSWVGLLNNYFKCRLSIIDTACNLGVMGANNYNAMPTSYIPPASRPYPDAAHNVSKAVVLLNNLSNADNGVVIVNYPTNNYITYSIEEILNTLQIIYDSVTAKGNRCFISTTQPRNDPAFNTSSVKKKLADLKDSILNRFNNNAINFWDGMYNSSDTTILAKYSYGDHIHFNNAGHRVLFERVLAKNIFGLPVWYSKSSGNLDELGSWGSNADGSGTSPSSFTADGQLFYIVNNALPSVGANWTIGGRDTQLIVGDGINPVNFVIPDNLQVNIIATKTNSSY